MKAQDLKNSILQMAVQGKLVPQDPSDEPASVLLERIREERAELIKQKKIKAPKGGESVIYRGGDSWYERRGKSDPVCIDDEIPFDIPDSWEWARLDTVGIVNMGQSPKGEYVGQFSDGVEFHQGKIKFTERFLAQSDATTIAPTKIAVAGSVLVCVRAPVGKVNITQRNICIGRGLCSVSPLCEMGSIFLFSWLSTYEGFLNKQATGSTFKAVSADQISSLLLPIPPLAEQQRIVERIDELMPLVEEYGELEDARETLDAALPDRLRKSVLQMAVEGKLVEQDPGDEPASELLERIREERAELVRQKKIKAPKGGESVIYRENGSWYEHRGKSAPVCIDDEIPFGIPESWEWCRLREVVDVQLGKMLDKAKNVGTPVDYLGNANVQWGYFDLVEMKKMKMSETDLIRFKLNIGDLIVCEGGVPGRCAIWNREEDMWYQKALHRLRPLLEGMSIEYCSLFIEWAVKTNAFPSSFTGSTIKHLPARNLESWLIPLPPASEQRRIVAIVKKSVACFEEKLSSNRGQNE